MKLKKIILLILVSIICSSNITGCKNPSNTSTAETPYYMLNIDGEKKYFSEDNEDIKDVTELIASYLTLSGNIDYNSEDYLEFLDLYTDEIKVEDEETGIREYLKESNIERQLIRTLDDFSIHEIEFFNVHGEYNAIVSFDSINTVTSATDDYLEGLGIELNKKYSTASTIQVKKQSDGWRLIELLTVGDKIEVE